MMKGPESYALSVRKPDGEIAVTVTEYVSFGERYKFFQIPILRGIVNFIESLYIGMKTLMDSSEYMEDEETEKDKKTESKSEVKTEEASDKKATSEKKEASEKKESSDTAYLVGTLVVSLAMAIAIFVLLPTFIAGFLYKLTDNSLIVNSCEGVLRLLIFIGYVFAISFMKDIRRTYMYHGAEHKSINCIEAGNDLTVENVRKATRFHRRCGTSFIFIVMFISIFVFMFVPTKVLWLRMVTRLLLVPVIAGISYEFIRYAGRHDNIVSRILSTPGLWVQRLTTREPDDQMIEVAIKSVEGVLDWHEYVECIRNNSFER